MKRMLMTVALLSAASSLTFAQADKKNVDLGKNPASDAIIARTNQLRDAIKNKDVATYDKLVVGDVVLVNAQGRATKEEYRRRVFDPDYTIVSTTMDNPMVTSIDNDAAIVTYKSTTTSSFKGESRTSTTYFTIAWAKRGGDWVMVFGEGIAAPPQPTSSGSK